MSNDSTRKHEEWVRELEERGALAAAADLREWAARDERVKANAPNTVPDCPSWCALPAGHEYEAMVSYEDDETFVRYHISSESEACVVQQEWFRRGLVTLMPAAVEVSVAEGRGYDAAEVRDMARHLAEAAEVLDQVNGDQRRAPR